MVKKRYKTIFLFVLVCVLMVGVVRAPPPPADTLPGAPDVGGGDSDSTDTDDLTLPDIDAMTLPDTITPDGGTSGSDGTSNGADSSGSSSIGDIGSEVQELKTKMDDQAKAIDTLSKDIDKIEEKIDEYFSTKSSPLSGIYVLIIVVVVILAVFAFLFLYNKGKKESMHKTENKGQVGINNNVSMANVNKLRNYISFNLKKGYNAVMLKQALLKQGHRKEEIDMAFMK